MAGIGLRNLCPQKMTNEPVYGNSTQILQIKSLSSHGQRRSKERPRRPGRRRNKRISTTRYSVLLETNSVLGS